MYPTDIDIVKERVEAKKRRDALVAAGCSTYVLGWRDGHPRIICLCCGLGSTNTRDIKELYCGFCHELHRDWQAEEPDPRYRPILEKQP